MKKRHLGELDEGQPVPNLIGIQQVAKVIAKSMTSTTSIDGLLFPAGNHFQDGIKACLSVISKAKGLKQETDLLFLYAATMTRYAYLLTSGGDLGWTRSAAARG